MLNDEKKAKLITKTELKHPKKKLKNEVSGIFCFYYSVQSLIGHKLTDRQTSKVNIYLTIKQ